MYPKNGGGVFLLFPLDIFDVVRLKSSSTTSLLQTKINVCDQFFFLNSVDYKKESNKY